MHICEFIYSVASGGAEMMGIRLALHAVKKGHRATVLTIAPLCAEDEDSFQDKTIKNLRENGVQVLSLAHQQTSLKAKVLFLWNFLTMCRKEHFDIIHSHGAYCDILNGIARIVYGKRIYSVATMHSSVIFRKGLVAKFNFFCHRHILHSYFCGEEAFLANKDILPRSGFIPNGVPEPEKQSDGTKAQIAADLGIKLDPEKYWIVSVGALRSEKKRDSIIQAAALAKENGRSWQVLLIGDGVERSRYVDMVQKLQLEDTVCFTGARNDVNRFLQAADVFASGSVFEGLPLAVLEASMLGLPSVVSPIAPHYALAKELYGCTVAEANTGEAFYKALCETEDRRNPKEEILEKNRTALQKYSFESCFQKYYGAVLKA